jgi:hypothetical protein
LTENVAFLIDFDPNLTVFTCTHLHVPLWITPKGGQRGTGNREPETWGHLFLQVKAGQGVTIAPRALFL